MKLACVASFRILVGFDVLVVVLVVVVVVVLVLVTTRGGIEGAEVELEGVVGSDDEDGRRNATAGDECEVLRWLVNRLLLLPLRLPLRLPLAVVVVACRISMISDVFASASAVL
jgi:hypothetical protein